MDPLKQLFAEKSQALKKEVKELLQEHGNKKVDEVSLDQVYGGMRDITCMIWEPSLLDAEEGIRFRGYSIPELREKLPSAPKGKEPLPEGLFWLMLVGEIPTKEQVKWLTENWMRRANVPEHVFRAIDALPVDSHLPVMEIGLAWPAAAAADPCVDALQDFLARAFGAPAAAVSSA